MQGTKNILESKTIWGGIVVILAAAIGLGHYTISPEDQARLTELLTNGAAVLGGILAIYGRIVASKEVKV